MDNATAARFWGKVQIGSPTDCWLWKPLGSVHGYGQFSSKGKTHLAHRFSYLLAKGPIEPGLTIDHLCRVRNCVNPTHLEAVTRAENLRRAQSWENGAAFQREKTHCSHGHPYAGENLRICKDGKRACRACNRRYSNESKARKRALNPLQPRPRKEVCKNGHAYATVGRTTNGGCKECAREALRRSRARAKAAQPQKVPDTHCRHGHEWNDENTYVSPGGLKACRVCHRDKSREWYRERAAERRAQAA
ncbi:HNH endonuclease signature motif containing protein [Streptomyces lavendulae]|uniref:HNH endonuclease signature motif containing protein n=1 Tax=Streptomyces lavendulae TaxID=1914 RepID=UPI00337C7C52